MGFVQSFAPGRTEIAGNHTDHQGGRAIAAALDCGVAMELRERNDLCARVDSAGFPSFEIELGPAADQAAGRAVGGALASEDPAGGGRTVGQAAADHMAPLEEERFTTAALVRGVVAGLREAGVPVGGFEAKVSSTVPSGGGLSSSAAFELALAAGLAALYSDVSLSPTTLARIGQRAERTYFGKPCGLLDQLAIALGGVALMDFANADDVRYEKVDFDFARHGYALCLVDTHCDHSLYTDEYAQVASDMFTVAKRFGQPRLSKVPEAEFLSKFEEIRSELGDLPALRGLHYYHEMHLVEERANALRADDIAAFLQATWRSGASSAQYLQNVSCFGRAQQPAMAALALADYHVGSAGACRIHGGGFGGTVQVVIEQDRLGAFMQAMDEHLGAGSCHSYQIVGEGAHATRMG